MPPRPSIVIILLLLALAAASGCARGTSGGPGDGPSRADLARDLFSPERNGLEVQRWRVPDESGGVASTLSARADGTGINDEVFVRLERNGLRLVRVREADLERLQDDLRGDDLSADDGKEDLRPRVGVSEGWHGQVLDWRELLTWDVGGESVPLAVDGRVRRVSGGRVVLAMRAWTMPMETGTVLHLELRPAHRAPSRGNYDQLLARRGPTTAAFDSLRIELELEAGWAYLLTCAAPGEVWPMDRFRNRSAAGIGPGLGAGPEVELPPTIGAALLAVPLDPPRRDIVVFLPRLPATLEPTAFPADGITAGLNRTTP